VKVRSSLILIGAIAALTFPNMAYAHAGCPANFVSATGCTDVYLIKIQ